MVKNQTPNFLAIPFSDFHNFSAGNIDQEKSTGSGKSIGGIKKSAVEQSGRLRFATAQGTTLESAVKPHAKYAVVKKPHKSDFRNVDVAKLRHCVDVLTVAV